MTKEQLQKELDNEIWFFIHDANNTNEENVNLAIGVLESKIKKIRTLQNEIEELDAELDFSEWINQYK